MIENSPSEVDKQDIPARENLSEQEQRVIQAILDQASISRNSEEDFLEKRTFGERVADRIAKFGGSWTFIGICVASLLSWIAFNSFFLAPDRALDPYPFILLNLMLSMLAALQAPVILMSQNREAMKDRANAAHDYEVNLKAELEIRNLHEKLDELREQKWIELIETQDRQIRMLEQLVAKIQDK